MDSLLSIDQQLFHLINQDWTAPWADAFFPAITDLHKYPWFFPIALAGLWAAFFRIYRWRAIVPILGLALAVVLSDFWGGKVMKPFFGRLRPNQAGLDAIVRVPHYGGASFVSNHASNLFCAAVFLAFFFPRARWPLLLLAALVSYSRVYCGVHYPTDVLAGAIQGALIGGLAALALLRSPALTVKGLSKI